MVSRSARPFRFPRLLRTMLAFAACGGLRLAALDAPVSPDASPEAASLLDFLGSIAGQQVLAGQQETVDWFGNDNEAEMDFLLAKTGKLPAYRGFDFMFMSDPRNKMQRVAERAIQWAQRGGVVTICYHWFAGTPRAAFYTADTDFSLTRALTPGTADNTEFLAEMDLVAAELKKLHDAGVPVVWRPFHECSGGWFWWGAQGAAKFKEAYRFMFDRFTREHGLNNLLWCYNPTDAAGALEAWYPGDSYVDVVSLDVYPPNGTHPTFAAEYKRFRDFTGGRKLVTMTENGPIPNIDQMFADGANWSTFCTWAGGFVTDGNSNSVAFLQSIYTHPKVITLDEMPDVYHFASAAPAVVVPPADTVGATGSRVTLAVLARGTPPLTYQWTKNGVNVPGATGAELTLAGLTATDAGAYRVKVTNPAGSTTSGPADLAVSPTTYVAPASRLVAISTRAFVQSGDDVPIVGFRIVGSGAKRLMIRAAGPLLQQLGVTNTVADPQIVVTRVNGDVLSSNDNWASGSQASAAMTQSASVVGLTPFAFGSADAAVIVALPEGAYTAIVRGAAGGTGNALLELYDLDATSAARLLGLSTRAWVGTGDNVMIAGVVMSGAGESLLVRALGPKLAGYGVAGTLADPQLELVQIPSNTVIAANDDWSATPALVAGLNAATTGLGLDGFAPGSKDSALLQPLSAGIFTATVRGSAGGTGVALVEVYEAP